MAHLSVTFGPTDVLNPDAGYQLRIVNEYGSELLFTGKHPVTGAPLLSAEQCLEVVGFYTGPTEAAR